MREAVDDEVVLLVSNLPDRESALAISRQLLDERLIACANLLAACESIYCWQGEVCVDSEQPVWFKTRHSLAQEARDRLAELHPYEVPEVLIMRVDALPSYRDWVVQETRAAALLAQPAQDD